MEEEILHYVCGLLGCDAVLFGAGYERNRLVYILKIVVYILKIEKPGTPKYSCLSTTSRAILYYMIMNLIFANLVKMVNDKVVPVHTTKE